jgi:carboxymethylenebutenolidase
MVPKHLFATAVQPEVAETALLTPSDGLDERWIHVPVEHGNALPVFVASPLEAQGSLPTILVVQEIFGVHEYVKDVARRLARLGYLALAPELYFRFGDPSKAPDFEALRTDFVNKIPDSVVMSDLDATVGWAASHGGDHSRLGIVGFCWGGRIAWLYAAHQPELKAAVAWYGRLAGFSTPTNPRHPLDVSDSLLAPVLGLYGGADAAIPLADVEKLRASLVAADSPSSVVVYPEAPHAFHADYRQSYRPADAADGWARMLAWFTEHGA